MAEALPELREAFETLFIAPFASHRWASARGHSHWVDLEGWQGSMAGPLLSISSAGGCDYVYLREDWYFAGINDPAGLRARLLEWHAGLAAGVERFAPTDSDEAADLTFMRSVVGRMRELVERACVVEQARWEGAKQAEPLIRLSVSRGNIFHGHGERRSSGRRLLRGAAAVVGARPR